MHHCAYRTLGHGLFWAFVCSCGNLLGELWAGNKQRALVGTGNNNLHVNKTWDAWEFMIRIYFVWQMVTYYTVITFNKRKGKTQRDAPFRWHIQLRRLTTIYDVLMATGALFDLLVVAVVDTQSISPIGTSKNQWTWKWNFAMSWYDLIVKKFQDVHDDRRNASRNKEQDGAKCEPNYEMICMSWSYQVDLVLLNSYLCWTHEMLQTQICSSWQWFSYCGDNHCEMLKSR